MPEEFTPENNPELFKAIKATRSPGSRLRLSGVTTSPAMFEKALERVVEAKDEAIALMVRAATEAVAERDAASASKQGGGATKRKATARQDAIRAEVERKLAAPLMRGWSDWKIANHIMGPAPREEKHKIVINGESVGSKTMTNYVKAIRADVALKVAAIITPSTYTRQLPL